MVKKKTAIIYGSLGQDGYLMSKILLHKKYKVVSIYHKKNVNKKIKNSIYLKKNLQQKHQITNLIKKYKPEEVYNFTGPSSKTVYNNYPVKSFDEEISKIIDTLEAIKLFSKETKYFHCSSSEVFGTKKRKVNEMSQRHPENLYAVTKCNAEIIIDYYKNVELLNCGYGILFNHDSKYRKKDFLYKKIIDFFTKKNINKKLLINNIGDIKFRSKAEKIIQVIWKIMQKSTINNYILSGDKSYSVKGMINNIALQNKIKLKWKQKKGKYIATSNGKIIVESIKNNNDYLIIPNLGKLKKNVHQNLKELRLF